jgi:hypothetical protein
MKLLRIFYQLLPEIKRRINYSKGTLKYDKLEKILVLRN